MKLINTIRTALFPLLACLALQPALAWDGTITGTVGNVQFDQSTVSNVYVQMSTFVPMCGTGTTSIAYTNSNDANYKLIAAALMTARINGSSVTIYTTNVSGSCHIGYVTM